MVSRRTLTLSLCLTHGLGGKTVTRILTRNDLLGRSCDEFLRLGAGALVEEYRLKAKAAENWVQNRKTFLKEAADLEATLEPHGVSVVTAADAHYPRHLETFDPDPPGILYLYGNTKLTLAETFCVLASRGSSDSVLAEIEKRTEEHVLKGRTLVSGHDTPEYQRSAVTCLRWGTPRIMVFDTGFFEALGANLREEPFAAARLWRYSFDPQTDLALSAVNPVRTYHPNSNKVRDGLVAGLSYHVELVNANQGGNMERLGKLAIRAGRKVSVSDLSPTFDQLVAAGAEPVPWRG